MQLFLKTAKMVFKTTHFLTTELRLVRVDTLCNDIYLSPLPLLATIVCRFVALVPV